MNFLNPTKSQDHPQIMPTSPQIILASQSAIRQKILRDAGVIFKALPARVDEETVLLSLQAENASPRDIADTLAELKAEKIARKYPEAVVLGSDQILSFQGKLLTKPETPEIAREHISAFSGGTHSLISAAVIYFDGKPVWRNIAIAKMTVRNLSEDYIGAYVDRNWSEIQYCAGAYQIESEGARLFSRIDGSYHAVLGLPLLPVLGYLTQRGWIEG